MIFDFVDNCRIIGKYNFNNSSFKIMSVRRLISKGIDK